MCPFSIWRFFFDSFYDSKPEASTCCCMISVNSSTFLPWNEVLYKETIQALKNILSLRLQFQCFAK